MISKTGNHTKAPTCAAFVEQMREVFGEVKVLYVKEGSFELGEPDRTEYGYFVQNLAVSKNSRSRRHVEESEEAQKK